MADNRCIQIGVLTGGKWATELDKNRRVYSEEGIAPTILASSSGSDVVPKVAIRKEPDGRKDK